MASDEEFAVWDLVLYWGIGVATIGAVGLLAYLTQNPHPVLVGVLTFIGTLLALVTVPTIVGFVVVMILEVDDA